MTLSDGFAAALLQGAGAILCYAAVGFILLLAGFYAVDLTTPGRLITIIRAERNRNATLLAVCGMVAVGLIVVASIWTSGGTLAEGLLVTLVWGVLGVVAQIVSSLIFRVLLGIDVAGLMRQKEIDPAAVLLGAMQVTIGAVTAISVI
jgi:uncharacterized membrane protein YjfL (UPF0719 family)